MEPEDESRSPDLLQLRSVDCTLGEVTTPRGEVVPMLKLHLHVWEERIGSAPRPADLPAVWMPGPLAWELAESLQTALTQHGLARPAQAPPKVQ